MAKESKTFNLRPAESNLLSFTQRQQQSIFSGIISTIVADRFSYQVTERTQFHLNADFTEVVITEIPEEPIKKEEPEASPVRAAK